MFRATTPAAHRAATMALTIGVLIIAALMVGSIREGAMAQHDCGAAARASVQATPDCGTAVVEWLIPDTPKGRARFGNIFLGTVLAEVGCEAIPLSDGSALTARLYDVAVDQPLKGHAQGVVRIFYTDLEALAPAEREMATLHPGDRALFFAGYDPEEDRYPVSAVLGMVRVLDDRQGAELIALYRPLIRKVSKPRGVAIVDRGCDPVAICRAQHGNIFLGRVVDLVKSHGPRGPLQVSQVIYTVDVERVVRASLAPGPDQPVPEGRIRINITNELQPMADPERGGPLAVGERYLFFAGMDVGRGYLVDGELGFLPAASDEEVERLLAEYAPLIRQVVEQDQAARARATEAARYEPATPPAAQLTPARGPAGSEVMVTGSGFSQTESLLMWDAGNPERLPSVKIPRSGEFEAILTVPQDLEPGEHTLSVEGLGSDVVELTFIVEQ